MGAGFNSHQCFQIFLSSKTYFLVKPSADTKYIKQIKVKLLWLRLQRGRKITQMSPTQLPIGPSSSPRDTPMNNEGPPEGSLTTTGLDDLEGLFLF